MCNTWTMKIVTFVGDHGLPRVVLRSVLDLWRTEMLSQNGILWVIRGFSTHKMVQGFYLYSWHIRKLRGIITNFIWKSWPFWRTRILKLHRTLEVLQSIFPCKMFHGRDMNHIHCKNHGELWVTPRSPQKGTTDLWRTPWRTRKIQFLCNASVLQRSVVPFWGPLK